MLLIVYSAESCRFEKSLIENSPSLHIAVSRSLAPLPYVDPGYGTASMKLPSLRYVCHRLHPCGCTLNLLWLSRIFPPLPPPFTREYRRVVQHRSSFIVVCTFTNTKLYFHSNVLPYTPSFHRNYNSTEPVFLNVYGAPELIPRNEFRQPM